MLHALGALNKGTQGKLRLMEVEKKHQPINCDTEIYLLVKRWLKSGGKKLSSLLLETRGQSTLVNSARSWRIIFFMLQAIYSLLLESSPYSVCAVPGGYLNPE